MEIVNKENLIRLTEDVYNLTILFPKKDPLRYKIRESAIEILANSILIFEKGAGNSKDLFIEANDNFETLKSFLEVAKRQNWVREGEILQIQQEYVIVMQEIKRISEVQNQTFLLQQLQRRLNLGRNFSDFSKDSERPDKMEKTVTLVNKNINERQRKILETLKNKEKIQVWELKLMFPGITKRTLRRDFESLVDEKLVQRIGSKNNTAYKILEIGH